MRTNKIVRYSPPLLLFSASQYFWSVNSALKIAPPPPYGRPPPPQYIGLYKYATPHTHTHLDIRFGLDLPLCPPAIICAVASTPQDLGNRAGNSGPVR